MPAPVRRVAAAHLFALLLLAIALPRPSRAAELTEEQWRDARKQARRLMKEPGERVAKQEVIEVLGRDDSRRAAELLVDWTLRSLKLQQGDLEKALAEAKEDLDKLERILLKAYPRMPPTRVDDKNAWDRARGLYEGAVGNVETEVGVRFSLGEALGRLRDAEAVSWLVGEGLPEVQRAKRSEEAQVAIAKCVFAQPKERALATALAMAADAKRPKLRMLALDWFGQHKVAEGFEPLVEALGAREVAIRRIAVAALRALDDPRAVRPLIEAMAGAGDDLLLAEMDDALHWFTGRSFEASPTVWKRWWSEEGEAWLSTASEARHPKEREALPGGTRVRFYGIPTESHHVVFVLDRSGSMKDPAGDRSIEKKKEKPKGPVTGDGGEGGKERKGRDAVAGDTKIEVAKNQLALSVEELQKDVRFAVVFYSNDVKVWREPPELMPSSRANKKDATAWFMGLEAQGPTLMFPALMKALEFADTVGEDVKKPRQGADTIFLLSDGSPTTPDGQVLSSEDLERAYREFLEANRIHRCIVHTIGIGPGHNRALLQRIARDTGGQYKAVGTR